MTESSSETSITLGAFSELTGLPVDLIREELFLDESAGQDDILSMNDLRTAMLKYLDQTMLNPIS